jgi:hypothetical protein
MRQITTAAETASLNYLGIVHSANKLDFGRLFPSDKWPSQLKQRLQIRSYSLSQRAKSVEDPRYKINDDYS